MSVFLCRRRGKFSKIGKTTTHLLELFAHSFQLCHIEIYNFMCVCAVCIIFLFYCVGIQVWSIFKCASQIYGLRYTKAHQKTNFATYVPKIRKTKVTNFQRQPNQQYLPAGAPTPSIAILESQQQQYTTNKKQTKEPISILRLHLAFDRKPPNVPIQMLHFIICTVESVAWNSNLKQRCLCSDVFLDYNFTILSKYK